LQFVKEFDQSFYYNGLQPSEATEWFKSTWLSAINDMSLPSPMNLVAIPALEEGMNPMMESMSSLCRAVSCVVIGEICDKIVQLEGGISNLKTENASLKSLFEEFFYDVVWEVSIAYRRSNAITRKFCCLEDNEIKNSN